MMIPAHGIESELTAPILHAGWVSVFKFIAQIVSYIALVWKIGDMAGCQDEQKNANIKRIVNQVFDERN